MRAGEGREVDTRALGPSAGNVLLRELTEDELHVLRALVGAGVNPAGCFRG